MIYLLLFSVNFFVYTIANNIEIWNIATDKILIFHFQILIFFGA